MGFFVGFFFPLSCKAMDIQRFLCNSSVGTVKQLSCHQLDVLSIFIFGANDPADSMYRRCQPALFLLPLSFFFSSFVGFSLGFALLS